MHILVLEFLTVTSLNMLSAQAATQCMSTKSVFKLYMEKYSQRTAVIFFILTILNPLEENHMVLLCLKMEGVIDFFH